MEIATAAWWTRDYVNALECGDVDEAMDILLNTMEPPGVGINMPQEDGYTILHAAAVNNRAREVAKLVKMRGVNVNCVTCMGDTPLVIACQRGYATVVEQLLKVPRVDVGYKDIYGRTAAETAMKNREGDYRQCVTLIEQYTSRRAARSDTETECKHCALGDSATKLWLCSGCSSVRYCSVECQRKDWKSHKKECKAHARKDEEVAPSQPIL